MKERHIPEKALLVGMTVEEVVDRLVPGASAEFKAQIEATLEDFEGAEEGIDFEDFVEILKPGASPAEKDKALKELDKLEAENRKKLRQIAKEILAEDEEDK